MTGSGVDAGGIGVGAGGSGVGAGVGVATGVGVAFTVTAMVASGPVSGCFGAGVGSIVFGSVPCVSVSSTLEVDACALSCFVCGEVV